MPHAAARFSSWWRDARLPRAAARRIPPPATGSGAAGTIVEAAKFAIACSAAASESVVVAVDEGATELEASSEELEADFALLPNRGSAEASGNNVETPGTSVRLPCVGELLLSCEIVRLPCWGELLLSCDTGDIDW